LIAVSKKRSKRTVLIAIGVLALLLVPALGMFATMRFSGDTWYLGAAPLPSAWPALTPVDEIEIKSYPRTRAAVVSAAATNGATGPLFMQLFRHIWDANLPMTSPVVLDYRALDEARVTSMAFLYTDTSAGALGTHGAVEVLDRAPASFASIGVRGEYSLANFELAADKLRDWLAANDAWQIAGAPRCLAYSNPLVPPPMKFGEIQVPVVARAAVAD